MALHLDTHIVVWLYTGLHDRFPESLHARLESEPLRYSPMTRLELGYLHEIGRVIDPPEQVLGELAAATGLSEYVQPFSRVVDLAGRMTFTRDPFDRVIMAHTLAAQGSLATKDRLLRSAYPDQTVWD